MLYYILGLFKMSSILRAFISIFSVILFKVGYIIFVMNDKNNFNQDSKESKKIR